MNIAYLGPTGVFGGVRVIAEHLNRLQARGHACTLLATDGGRIGWLPTAFEQRPAADPGAGYDVVVGTALNTWPMALDLARQLGAKSSGLLQMAEWLSAPKDSVAHRTNLAAFATPLDSVMAISEWLAQLAEQVDGRRVARIRNGIDTKLFYRQPMPDAPDFDGLTIVTEGYSASPAKDADEMVLRALRHLRYDLGRKVRIIGFSQYPQPAEIYDKWWTQPAQNAIRMIYSLGDVFLKATRYEGRPGPDLEAMACGTPVCRAIGLGDDDLRDGVNCLKVPYGDQAAFVANLVRLLDDAELRAKLSAAGLDYATSQSWDGVIDAIEETLTGAVTQPREVAETAHSYELSDYNAMQAEIVQWETPQAMWLGQTLADLLAPASVLDVGCGPGIYLVPFKPAARVLGVDGAPQAGQALEPAEFVQADFRAGWAPPGRFDLALCIEVAEHLPPDRAGWLVDTLTASADVIFFSAAQPGQGGTLHLNERPREDWLADFRARGYDLHPQHDALAAAIAANPHCQRVQWLVGNAMLLEKRP